VSTVAVEMPYAFVPRKCSNAQAGALETFGPVKRRRSRVPSGWTTDTEFTSSPLKAIQRPFGDQATYPVASVTPSRRRCRPSGLAT
jgi:hypothetical protein